MGRGQKEEDKKRTLAFRLLLLFVMDLWTELSEMKNER